MSEPTDDGPDSRRETVRARVSVPVVAAFAGRRVRGSSVDLSEGGAQCLLDDAGGPIPPGTVLELELLLGGTRVWLTAAVLRVTRQRQGQSVVVRFIDPNEHDRDAVRARVFSALRRDLARGLR